MKKKIVTVILSAIMVLIMGTSTFAASGTWQFDGYGWWYAYDAGGYAESRWENIDGFWYHFNEYGYMDTGWIWDGAWYYMNPDGSMATGWIWDGYNWYYMSGSGAMYTGWKWDGAWYYLNPNGTMATGWLWDGAWYFMDPGTGVMYTGWLWDGYNWYYLNSSGVMVTGTQVINGVTYSFDANGVWQAGNTTLLNEIGGKNYYHSIPGGIEYINISSAGSCQVGWIQSTPQFEATGEASGYITNINEEYQGIYSFILDGFSEGTRNDPNGNTGYYQVTDLNGKTVYYIQSGASIPSSMKSTLRSIINSYGNAKQTVLLHQNSIYALK